MSDREQPDGIRYDASSGSWVARHTVMSAARRTRRPAGAPHPGAAQGGQISGTAELGSVGLLVLVGPLYNRGADQYDRPPTTKCLWVKGLRGFLGWSFGLTNGRGPTRCLEG